MDDEKRKDLTDKPGIVSLILPDSPEEMLDIQTYIVKKENLQYLEYLSYILKNPEFLFLFMDLFAGKRINVPTRHNILRDIQGVRLYRYCKARGFSEESYRGASRIFKKKVSSVKSIVAMVRNVMEREIDDEY